MAGSKKTAVALAAGVLALGAGVGVASLASADPTPTPSPSSSPSAGTDGRDGHGPRGQRGLGADFAQLLAQKLGVDQAKVTQAIQAYRDANRPSANTTPDPSAKPDREARDAAVAKALAQSLGLDEARVTTAIAEIRAEGRAERAAALKARLDAAVKDGTLTQAEADAVTKAVEKGVIGGR